jgi:hypothetical protein
MSTVSSTKLRIATSSEISHTTFTINLSSFPTSIISPHTTLQNQQPTNAMPGSEHSGYKHPVVKLPRPVSDCDPGPALPSEAFGRLPVSEGEVDLENIDEPDAPCLSRADLLGYIEQLESNAKEFTDKNRAILESLKAQVSLTKNTSSSGVNAVYEAPESSSGVATGPNATRLPESFAPSASLPRSDSSVTVVPAPTNTDHHLDLPTSDGENNSKDANESPPKPDPIIDNADDETEPDAGNFADQDNVDYEEYLLLGEELEEFGWYRPSLLAAKQELTVRSRIMPWMDNTIWLNCADEVLASMEGPVLQAIMKREGNLNHLMATDGNVVQALQQNERRCLEHQPSVYVSALTHDGNKDFASFTVDEARKIARYAWSYAMIGSHLDGVAFLIDYAHHPYWQAAWSSQDARLFFHTDKLSTGEYGPINKRRQEVLNTFACALEKIAAQAERAGKLTIPVLHHVGYSINAHHRQQLRQSPHFTATWLTQFILAAAKVLGISTHLASHTVYVVPEHPCGPVAQMLLSRMARAYYFTGGLGSGSTACAASVAHMRSDAVTEEQEEAWWKEAENYMESNVGYRRRFEEEMRRRDELSGGAG